MSETIAVRVSGGTAEEACEAAKAWVRREPRLRLRTVCSARRALGPAGEPTSAWVVELAVNIREPDVLFAGTVGEFLDELEVVS